MKRNRPTIKLSAYARRSSAARDVGSDVVVPGALVLLLGLTRRRHHGELSAFAIIAALLFAPKRYEGRVLLVFCPSHGLTTSDISILCALAFLAVRRINSNAKSAAGDVSCDRSYVDHY